MKQNIQILKLLTLFILSTICFPLFAQPMIVDLTTSHVLLIGQTSLGVDYSAVRLTNYGEFLRQMGIPNKDQTHQQNLATSAQRIFDARPDGITVIKVPRMISKDLMAAIPTIDALTDINYIVMPGITDVRFQIEVAKIAEKLKNCIAIFELPNQLSVNEMETHKQQINSRHAAFFAPALRQMQRGVVVRDNVPVSELIVPYMITNDKLRGIHHTPNAKFTSSYELTRQFSQDEQQLLVDRNHINTLSLGLAREMRLSSFRTADIIDAESKYIALVRTRFHLRQSIERGLSWIFFENNNEQLWTRMRASIENYLHNKRSMGVLLGSTPNESFFVKVGLGASMTNDDILHNRTRALVGISLLRPAEFNILNFVFQR